VKAMAGGENRKNIPMTVTFLEMRTKPQAIPPSQPLGKIALLRAEKPPIHFYRYLYDTIGKDYYWVDRFKMDDASLAAIIQDPKVELYVLFPGGCPGGLAELYCRDAGTALLAYFGLMP
jgi:hypothetical protein